MPNKTENGVNAIVITYYGNFAEDNVPREVCRILMGRGYYPDSISTNHTHPSEIGFNEAYYYFGSPGVMPPEPTLKNILRDVNISNFKIIRTNK